jgi:hypothetical protein
MVVLSKQRRRRDFFFILIVLGSDFKIIDETISKLKFILELISK